MNEQYFDEFMAERKLRHATEARIATLEAALRKIVTEGKVYAGHNQLEHCAQAMYDIASGALLPQSETKPAPGFCQECLMTGGHKLSCSKAERQGNDNG